MDLKYVFKEGKCGILDLKYVPKEGKCGIFFCKTLSILVNIIRLFTDMRGKLFNSGTEWPVLSQGWGSWAVPYLKTVWWHGILLLCRGKGATDDRYNNGRNNSWRGKKILRMQIGQHQNNQGSFKHDLNMPEGNSTKGANYSCYGFKIK